MVGIAVCECLQEFGVDAGVKWPNDVYSNGKKLAGVLVETKIKNVIITAVIGVGINIDLGSKIIE